MCKKVAGILISLLLAAGLIYQIVGATQHLTNQLQNKFYANRTLGAVIRSADASSGSEFAAYISFLRALVPAQGTVLFLSGKESSNPLGDFYLMQYYLFPRKIETCSSDCSALITGSGAYVLAQGDFPPAELIPPSMQYIPFRNELGIYLPEQ